MPFLGIKGDGSFSTNERPKNWRQVILYLMPNASMPITALTSKAKSESVDDPEFGIFSKALPNQTATVNGSVTSGATTIPLNGTNPERVFKKGHAVLNKRTLEVMWVTADPTVANQITVSRGKGSTAASMNNGDGLLIIGSSHNEGSSAPTAVQYEPAETVNYCQIFRNTGYLTGTAASTKLRTGDPWKEIKREQLELHGMEMDKAFLFGTGVVDTTIPAQPQRTTKGVLSMLATNVTDLSSAGGMSLDSWENFLEGLFKNGSPEKLGFCGSRLLNVINKVARMTGTVETVPTNEVYGMSVKRWTTNYGDVMLKQHPLLSADPDFQSWGFFLDMDKLRYRYMEGRDTKWRDQIQNNDEDTQKGEFLSECGLELQFEQAHGVVKAATAAIP